VRKQRTLFYGRIPAQTPRKDGDNPLVPDRRFRATDAGEIEIRFNNSTVTQFGGYALWAQYLDDLGLNAALASHIKMSRGPMAFTAPELSRFLIDAKVLGADRLMHLERFRLDPALTSIAGIDGLPSGKTMGVYLKQFEPNHEAGLERLGTRLLDREWRRRCKARHKKGVILDYDSSTTTTYGKQEGADRGRSFRKKDKPGFQPKFCFIGGLGVMVHQWLEPQSHNLRKNFWQFHGESVAKLPQGAWIKGFRGDGALFDIEVVQACEEHGYTYGISAPLNDPLGRAVAGLRDKDWEEGEDERGRPYSIARLRHCPPTWDGKLRTFVISRRLKKPTKQGVLIEGEQYKYFAYVTDFKGPLFSQYSYCVERCSLESFIKEAKGSFDWQFLPCAELSANRAYLLHVQIAYNLAIFFKLLAAPNGVNRWTVETLRARVLCVCGNLRRRAGRWILSLPEWWPYQTVFRQLMRRCAAAFA
jgi:hypothetical protein